MSTLDTPDRNRIKIKPQLLCPHCWHEFAADQVLFISESPELLGDSKLGDTASLRFLPFRFDVSGAAIDSHKYPCHKIACPNCHLQIPRSLLHLSNSFISIVGAPASGKSYFLASMIWQLRKTMARGFCMSFADAEPEMNRRIRSDVSKQFDNDDPDKLVYIDKTQVEGDIYNVTNIGGQVISLAQPFIYTMSPMPGHPLQNKPERISRSVCLYDNAGESFLPGADKVTQPVTRHLATSDAILFLFDPTQNLRFKRACKQSVNDPQMNPELGVDVRKSDVPQEIILTEMITRVRDHLRLSPNEKHKSPLIIVLTKFDAWQQLTNFSHYHNPWEPVQNMAISAYSVKRVEEYSQILRKLLLDLIPDLVSTAETFSENVTYIAVSATGRPPEFGPPDNEGKRQLMFRSGEINPVWTEVPFFHAHAQARKYCIPVLLSKSKK
ncbi:MAG: hypothetical protein LBU65_05085 [Planctomycetaceae bacterium]|nr:hypothetical protein [Planctomycetaceae bacterium]